MISGIDTFLRRYGDLIATAGGFGMVRSGWGEAAGWRRDRYTEVLAAVDEVADRMAKALADANALIAAYDALPAATATPERFRLLEQIERLLTTTPPTPRPNTPQQLRSIINNRRQTFQNKLQNLRKVANTGQKTLSGLLAEVTALLPLTGLDPAGLTLTPYEDLVVAYEKELLDRARALQAEIAERLTAADAALTEHDAAVTGPDRVEAALDTLKALLGEDVLAVPEYTPAQPRRTAVSVAAVFCDGSCRVLASGSRRRTRISVPSMIPVWSARFRRDGRLPRRAYEAERRRRRCSRASPTATVLHRLRE
ncbi:hypothetical protein AB0M58_42340 [Streptomyces bobili]|uniref:hypothetical protein n=1 Tax=Streptomyces bobili TaxID=67280 RepID=UPI0034133F80